YVATDAGSDLDPQKLRDKNFGSVDTLAVSYSYNVQGAQQLLALSLVKFGDGELKGKTIQSATLQMVAIRADLTQPARLVDVSLVNGDWSEKALTFNTRPAWNSTPLATTAVYSPSVW